MKPLIFVLALDLTAVFSVPLVAQSAQTQTVSAPAVVIPLGTRVGLVATGYDDGGRRDPFMALVAPKRSSSGQPAEGRPKAGLAAVAIADVVVRGIVKNGDAMLAILEAPNKQSFVSRPKDRLLDGTIKSIDNAGVVFAEQGESGPASQVRKALRTSGE